MNLKYFFLLFMLSLFFGNVYAQDELNPYKYIIVPKQYDFLKEQNQYRVNSYTKFLFTEAGYKVFYDDGSLPDDLISDPCLALRANVINRSSAFTTKLFLVLENCAGQEVFRSIEGKSKMKEFDKTYADALKKSFVSVEALNYEYEPNTFQKKRYTVAETSAAEVAAPVAVTTVVSQEKQVDNKKKDVQHAPAAETLTEENTKPSSAAVLAVPVLVQETSQEETPEAASVQNENVARAFQNEKISFLLLDQGAQLQAFVSQSKNDNYKPGELIGTFKKSSLPNVFKVSWKKPMDGVEETTAYFDDQGNLRVDVYQDGTLKTLTFTEVK